MNYRIDTVSGRQKLVPRREPYWYKLSQGFHLGYRKLDDGHGRWIARKIENREKTYYSLESDDNVGFSDAQKLARKVLENAAGAKAIRYTVQNAIDHYIEYLKLERSQESAHDIGQRLKRHVPLSLKDTLLVKVNTMQIKHMQYKMVKTFDTKSEETDEKIRKSKDTANRVMNMFRAALNLAFRNDFVQSDSAWRKVKNFKGVSQNRKIFLTDLQVQNLIKVSREHFRYLVEAAIYTGARYGELAQMRAADYDSANRVINIRFGKTGPRQIYLSSSAAQKFDAWTRLKLPNAPIFTQDGETSWGKNNHSRLFHEAAKQGDLPKGSVFYNLRHYYISKALMAKLPLQFIAENCGTSIRMIEKHYGKFMESDRRELVDLVELPSVSNANL
ncbi:MAG: tyrosine-type recombinase/integrase [Methylophaga sp.]|nr:tyrosine-type recombinase/integrase [Methylophaga sp.]